MLPLGTTREQEEVSLHYQQSLFRIVYGTIWQDWEEVVIPPARAVPPKETESPIQISSLDPLAKGSFPVSCMC